VILDSIYGHKRNVHRFNSTKLLVKTVAILAVDIVI
jgi:hypothetical protein